MKVIYSAEEILPKFVDNNFSLPVKDEKNIYACIS